ncbi:MAG: glycoside hydrolase family 13 protein [Flammeovirgaceae bacterium]|jgi:cyclomaltodextrinase|nr:glycoside hydrolase family 13 protein [Flammeovirgaceae bacterium]
MRRITLFLLFGFVTLNTNSIAQPDAPATWAKNAIWYQIFVERFYNGDATNDPTSSDIAQPFLNNYAPANWQITPWTHDWYKPDAWFTADKPFHHQLQYRRYGGDLQGVLDKLDYLQALGVTAIFFNPLNHAPSLHKYDATSYHHIDANFGPDPEGDKKIMATENPADPSTWKWTKADLLFLKLVDEIHKRNMRVILDYSWNHTGTNFWAWQDVVKNQSQSSYKDWYAIKQFDDATTPQNEFAYEGWLNIMSLPEILKTEIKTTRKVGYPYEGTINEGAKKHMFEVAKRWLAPNGDTSKGIDGYRLDVADQIGLQFWREFRNNVRAIQPNAYLVGEIWWQEWPDKLMNPVPYTKGDVFDAVMFYQAYRPARYFFAKTNFEIDAAQFKDSLEFQWKRVRKENLLAMMNVASSHDSPRLLSDFYNPYKYKAEAVPHDNPSYRTNKPDAETYQRVRLYLVQTFTAFGAPHIWNGEEMGMWGADDPYQRKPLMWPEFTFEPERKNNIQTAHSESDGIAFNNEHFEFYRKLIAIRKSEPALTDGSLHWLTTKEKVLAYSRQLNKQEIIIVLNAATSEASVPLQNKVYVNLLSGEKIKVKNNQLTLKPLEAYILK